VRWALLLISLAQIPLFAARTAAQARPEAAGPGRKSSYARLDDALQSLEREPVLLIAEGLEPLLEPAVLRARLSALFGRPVVSPSDPEAGSALATLYCSRTDARAAAGHRHGFITLRLITQELDLRQRVPARGLSADAAGAIANVVIDMLWSDRIARLGGSELLDPFCPPGMTCSDADHPARPFFAVRRAPEPSLVDPWAAGEPRYTLLESRVFWPRGDPWGAPGANVKAPVKQAPAAPTRADAGVSEPRDRAE
jgi:hypothetical protein